MQWTKAIYNFGIDATKLPWSLLKEILSIQQAKHLTYFERLQAAIKGKLWLTVEDLDQEIPQICRKLSTYFEKMCVTHAMYFLCKYQTIT